MNTVILILLTSFAIVHLILPDIEPEHARPTRQVSADVQHVVREFNEYLQTLPKPIASDIAKRIQTVANKLLD